MNDDIQMSLIILMSGLPYSGKSTCAREASCAQSRISSVISVDQFIEKEASDRNTTYSEIFNETIQEAEKQFWKSLQFLLQKDDNDIIIDKTHLTEKSRNKTVNFCSRYRKNASFEIITCVCTNAELLKRRIERKSKFLSDSVLNHMKKIYTYPTKDNFLSLYLATKFNWSGHYLIYQQQSISRYQIEKIIKEPL